MKRNALALIVTASAALALLPGTAATQEKNAQAKRDIAVWADSFTTAFSPGWWDGEMQAFDAKGNATETTSNPSCIKAGESNKLAADMREAMTMLADVGDCTSQSGGQGSLNLEMRCSVGDRQVNFLSKGQYSDGKVDWAVDFTFTGPDAPKGQSMKVSARRTRKNC